MDAFELQELLQEALRDNDEVAELLGVDTVYSFEENGLLSGNAGLVVRLDDGSEFQLTLVQSQGAR